ncbi:GIP [Symbiodinium sp. CCMP2592]|nr:GIP [Symbiodinium sp. CCMP2592]
MPELLPNYVQGWYLLHDSGLTAQEKNSVQTALQGDFRYDRVAQELRNQCAVLDGQRREYHPKNSGYMGELYDEEPDEDETQTVEVDPIMEAEHQEEWQEAEEDAQSALAAITQGRRTLKEVRQRQNNVRLARQYFRTNSGAGHRDGGKSRDEKMTCLRCGRTGHRVANCPDPPTAAAKSAEPVAATSSFVCFCDQPQALTVEQSAEDNTNDMQAMMSGISTADAVSQGKAVIDGGATKTLASINAMERIMQLNNLKSGHSGLISVDTTERPVFGFGNGSEDRCSSTVQLRICADKKPGEVKVHCLDRGTGPMLLSIDTLRKLKAVAILALNITKRNMPKATKEDLRMELLNHGETPPQSWTMVELNQRLRELREQGLLETEEASPNSTMEKMLKDLRRASKLKANLTKYCTEALKLELTGNEVMAKMIDKATKEIRRVCPAEANDLAGFGKHANERYVAIATQYQDYAAWVKTTFQESGEDHVDPRLARLAKWLLEMDRKPTPKAPPVTRKEQGSMKMQTPSTSSHVSGRTGTSRASTDPTSAQAVKMMQEMAEAMESMRQELAEVKGQRPHKTAGKNEEGHLTDGSLYECFSAAECSTEKPEHEDTIQCSSVIVNDNCQMQVQGDVNNLPNTLNHLIGVTPYQHGEYKSGHLRRTRHQVVTFDARKWHATQPWHGHRVTVGGYTSRGVLHLSVEEIQWLKARGFQWQEREQSAEVSAVFRKEAKKGSKVEEEIKRKLYLLHAATGHGSTKNLVEALKRRHVDPLVLRLAEEFQCPICHERKKAQPRQLASLEPLPPKFHTITADIGHWNCPHSGETQNFMIVVDEGLDPAGSFRSASVEDFCDRNEIYLDIIPGEAHWQIGTVENAIQGLKTVMTKLSAEDPSLSAEQVMSLAISTFNQRELVRGFSPVQHVLGSAPDETGRHLHPERPQPPDVILNQPLQDFRKEAELRASAEKALVEWQAQQRVTRAVNSRTRPSHLYHPGDLVYFWRTQESGRGKRSPNTTQGRFLGPARILAMETRRSADDEPRPAHSVWVVRGWHLMKCSPEQLRPASQREELVESLATSDQTPWTYTRLAEEIGGSQYEDISAEVPSEQEWQRAQDVQEEVSPPRTRIRGKRAAPIPDEDLDLEDPDAGEPSQPSNIRRVGQLPGPRHAGLSGEKWQASVAESAWAAEESCYWAQEEAAVAIEIEVPQSNRGWEKFLNNPQAYFVGALRRRAVEVSEKRLTAEDRVKFQEAKAKEVRNFIAAQAFEALPDHLKPSKDQAIGMRWLLTWKTQDDGQPPTVIGESKKGTSLEHFFKEESTVTRLKRACYGLVDALWSDACAWVWRPQGQLRGMVTGHVDDFLFGGSEEDQGWQKIIRLIKEKFRWGDWDQDKFVQCGVQIETTSDGFTLSQPHYLSNLEEIHINATRRKDRKAETTEWEKTQLRALLGGLSWFAQQTGPHLAAEVSMMLSAVCESRVETIIEANLLLQHAKERKNHVLQIFRHKDEDMQFYAWVDAANKNRAREGSTQGVFIGASSKQLLQGAVCAVSPMSWSSTKIDRSCRSPGSAETQAAVNGEDSLFYMRYQWAEMQFGKVNLQAPSETVKLVDGCLITDSRNVYDKLSTEVLTVQGAEKKANLELLSVKESQMSTNLKVRWVHSEAQLANALTKKGGKELELYYKMRFMWRIVEDPGWSAKLWITGPSSGREGVTSAGWDIEVEDCELGRPSHCKWMLAAGKNEKNRAEAVVLQKRLQQGKELHLMLYRWSMVVLT